MGTTNAEQPSLSFEEIQRYQRQIVLPEIGIEGQNRLKQAKVLCIGAGGLGSPVLLYLAASGIGTLGIVDIDKVDLSNLQRQILYSESDSGKDKVEVAAQHLKSLNKHLALQTYPVSFSADNAEKIMREYDLVIDGTDNFSTKYLINDCAVKCGIPYIYGSILGFEGRVAVLWAKTGPCYRCIYPEPPKGYIPNCAEFGIVGALAGIIGSIQALESIKLLLNRHGLKPLYGSFFVLDSRTMRIQTFTLAKNPTCPVCSKQKESIILADIQSVCAITHPLLKIISSSEVKSYIGQPHVKVIDVRETEEWETGHLPTAIHLPLSRLMSDKMYEKLNVELTYILYCQSGRRSQTAGNFLLEQGFNSIMNLTGGIAMWDGEIVKS